MSGLNDTEVRNDIEEVFMVSGFPLSSATAGSGVFSLGMGVDGT